MTKLIRDGNVVCPATIAGQADGFDDRPGVARSSVDDWRVALHEAGHVVVGRALGMEVGGVTIIQGPDFSGLTWGPKGNSARLSSVEEEPDICGKIAALMPKAGECRDTVAFSHVFVPVTDLRAGTASESVLYPGAEPWVAHSDIEQARSLASIICSSDASIEAMLQLGLEEAKSLIAQHRAAVLAIAKALVIHRTLDAATIDDIIATAPERARRADWTKVMESAANFAAGLES
jgi:hypothetical protein